MTDLQLKLYGIKHEDYGLTPTILEELGYKWHYSRREIWFNDRKSLAVLYKGRNFHYLVAVIDDEVRVSRTLPYDVAMCPLALAPPILKLEDPECFYKLQAILGSPWPDINDEL